MNDGQVHDRVPAVVERYQSAHRPQPIEVWSFNRRVRSVTAGWVLRIIAHRWEGQDFTIAVENIA